MYLLKVDADDAEGARWKAEGAMGYLECEGLTVRKDEVQ